MATGPKMTEHEISECIRMYTQEGMPTTEIGRILGRSNSAVGKALSKNGIKTKPQGSFSRNFSDNEEAQIADLYRSGISSKKIAKMYGLNHHISIVDAIRRQGVELKDVSARNQIYPFNHNAFDEIKDEHTAYWLGFIYADGYIGRNSLLVTLKLSDVDQLHNLSCFLQSNAPIRYGFGSYREKKNPNATGRYAHFHLSERLHQLGIQTGRPYSAKCLDEVPDCLHHHWIRGLFDGDGSARKSKSIAFCGDHDLMYLVRENVSSNTDTNPNLKIVKHRTAQLHYLYYSGVNTALKVAEYMYKDATIWMERKRKIIESWQ